MFNGFIKVLIDQRPLYYSNSTDLCRALGFYIWIHEGISVSQQLLDDLLHDCDMKVLLKIFLPLIY